MAAKNDVTGDSIASRGSSQEYRDNWDRIWGKKNDPTWEEIEEENRKDEKEGA